MPRALQNALKTPEINCGPWTNTMFIGILRRQATCTVTCLAVPRAVGSLDKTIKCAVVENLSTIFRCLCYRWTVALPLDGGSPRDKVQGDMRPWQELIPKYLLPSFATRRVSEARLKLVTHQDDRQNERCVPSAAHASAQAGELTKRRAITWIYLILLCFPDYLLNVPSECCHNLNSRGEVLSFMATKKKPAPRGADNGRMTPAARELQMCLSIASIPEAH